MAKETFKNEFVRDISEYPAKNFRATTWIHVGNKDWWALLTGFVLNKFERELAEGYLKWQGPLNMASPLTQPNYSQS